MANSHPIFLLLLCLVSILNQERGAYNMIFWPLDKFDENEWFIIISLVLVMTIARLLRKQISTMVVVFLLLFNVFLGQTVDYILAVPPYDLYDINDSKQYELFDGILYFLLYPPTAYIVIYFYARWRLKGVLVFAYLITWAFITTGLEWMAAVFHVFTYNEWKLIFSFPTYIAVYGLNIMVFEFAQYFLRNKMTSLSRKQINEDV
jgi:hypothetical protein